MGRAVPIGSFATRTEAELVVALLEAQGIAASVSADDAGGAYPFQLSGAAQVLVDESDAEEASQLLAERSGET
jgi:type III secretory pathway lipoprotein EscJ